MTSSVTSIDEWKKKLPDIRSRKNEKEICAHLTCGNPKNESSGLCPFHHRKYNFGWCIFTACQTGHLPGDIYCKVHSTFFQETPHRLCSSHGCFSLVRSPSNPLCSYHNHLRLKRMGEAEDELEKQGCIESGQITSHIRIRCIAKLFGFKPIYCPEKMRISGFESKNCELKPEVKAAVNYLLMSA